MNSKTEHLFERAVAFAADAHHGTCRKGTDIPYILHPMEAAAIVGSMTSDPCLLAAAVLHDVVEDAKAVCLKNAEHILSGNISGKGKD